MLLLLLLLLLLHLLLLLLRGLVVTLLALGFARPFLARSPEQPAYAAPARRVVLLIDQSASSVPITPTASATGAIQASFRPGPAYDSAASMACPPESGRLGSVGLPWFGSVIEHSLR